MGRFREALSVVLRFEGGFSDHPSDPGGATMRGVTQRVYDRWRRDQELPARSVREIAQHELEAIYLWRYWEPCKAGLLPAPLDLVQFDAAVNTGVRRSLRLLQEAAGSEPDGLWGPNTEAAVRDAPVLWLTDAALWARVEFYRRISKNDLRVFLRGWLWRVQELRRMASLPGDGRWELAA